MATLKIWDGTGWVEVKGEQGPPGADGNDGAPGAPGADGSDGNDGAPGPSPLHTGATAPPDPNIQGIWIDTSS